MLHEARSEDLIDTWTLVDADWRLVANKHGATRLGFALLLKFFESEARFPRDLVELPAAAVAYVAEQVRVPAAVLAEYGWSDRAATYHRAQIREAFGFRVLTREDETKLAEWLASEICPVEMSDERVREALLARCRAERIEPPGRRARLIAAARAAFEQQFCERTVARLSPVAIERLEDLVAEDDPTGVDTAAGRGIYGELKADPRAARARHAAAGARQARADPDGRAARRSLQ